ncbi:hypothetical protein PBAL39_10046 [Pedobacter sp. BAL39]|nr:hypothetical protein PBAL39_10046 [Pedobacter sp. BAL39]
MTWNSVFYLKNIEVIFAIPVVFVFPFKATSSLGVFTVLAARLSIIMTKTGTRSSRNGDTFDNFFIIVLF